MSDVSAVPTKKYKATWRGITTFKCSIDGQEIFLSHPDQAPLGRIALPVYETFELGRLRWIIEYNENPEDAEKRGRLDQRILDSHGNPVFAKLTSEGLWNFFFCVQTADGKFRDLDREVLEVVKEMWHYHKTASVEQKAEALIYAERRRKLLDKENAQNEWNSEPDKGIIEGVNELQAKEREFYREVLRKSNTIIFT